MDLMRFDVCIYHFLFLKCKCWDKISFIFVFCLSKTGGLLSTNTRYSDFIVKNGLVYMDVIKG